MNDLTQLLLTSIALGIVVGIPAGWCIRSLFVARDIERISRDAWKQARTVSRHGGEL